MIKTLALITILLICNHQVIAYAQKSVNGEVEIVSYNSGTLIVNGHTDDTSRAFLVDKKGKLKNIKVGDQVSVEPQRNNSSMAKKVTKTSK